MRSDLTCPPWCDAIPRGAPSALPRLPPLSARTAANLLGAPALGRPCYSPLNPRGRVRRSPRFLLSPPVVFMLKRGRKRNARRACLSTDKPAGPFREPPAGRSHFHFALLARHPSVRSPLDFLFPPALGGAQVFLACCRLTAPGRACTPTAIGPLGVSRSAHSRGLRLCLGVLHAPPAQGPASCGRARPERSFFSRWGSSGASNGPRPFVRSSPVGFARSRFVPPRSQSAGSSTWLSMNSRSNDRFSRSPANKKKHLTTGPRSSETPGSKAVPFPIAALSNELGGIRVIVRPRPAFPFGPRSPRPWSQGRPANHGNFLAPRPSPSGGAAPSFPPLPRRVRTPARGREKTLVEGQAPPLLRKSAESGRWAVPAPPP